MHNSYIEIDTDILRDNVSRLTSSLGGTRLIPVLKDNAYGLGLLPIASILEEFDGIQWFAVSHVSEGFALREAGIKKNILVMGGAVPFQYEAAIEAELTLACGRLGMASELAEIAARAGKRADVQIKIDTGLHRIGIDPGEELVSFIEELKSVKEHLSISGAFSHFSCSSSLDSDREQYASFCSAVKKIEDAGFIIPMKHISSSAASELYPEFNMDAVRIGRRLYMDNPTQPLGTVRELASWRSYITNIKPRTAGDSIGYGDGAVLEKDCVIATVGVGYGDGLNQDLVSVRAPVIVNGKRCPLIACCMDQCMVDVSGTDCRIGDEITFFGYDGSGNFLSSQEQAALVNDDEGCGLTSALSDRVARIYKA